MLVIKECKGYQLEKAKPNTSEDFFNKSEILFEEDGKEKKLEILYVRYLDEIMNQFTPFAEEPIFQVGSREVNFRDTVALACLLKHPEYRDRKRVYINSAEEFAAVYQNLDFEKLKTTFQSLGNGNSAQISM